MKSIFKYGLKVGLTFVLVILFAISSYAENKDKADNKDATGLMKVNIVSGKGNYNLKLHKNKKAKDVYLSIYDCNNTKVVTEKIKPGKSFKKKYNLSQYKSESFFFVIENGIKIHTEEVM